MRRLRTQLLHCVTPTLLGFVAMVAVPRAGFVVHDHSGGQHAHVHLQSAQTGDVETDQLLAEALGERVAPPPHRPHSHERSIGLPEVGSAIHWHAEHPYQLDVAIELPTLAGLRFIARAPGEAARAFAGAPAQSTRARAPPAVL